MELAGAARVVFWSGVVATLTWGASEVNAFLVRDPRFDFVCARGEANCASLEIRGVTYTSRARIQNVFAPDFGGSVFKIPLAERRRRLLAVDWVNTAAISRVWPRRIAVTITERTPVAFAKLPIAGTVAVSLFADRRGRRAALDSARRAVPSAGSERRHGGPDRSRPASARERDAASAGRSGARRRKMFRRSTRPAPSTCG